MGLDEAHHERSLILSLSKDAFSAVKRGLFFTR